MATVSIANTTANISGKTVTLAERDHTITGSWTFSRSPSAPFVVTAASAKVTNLDADKLDGQDGPTGPIVGTTDSQTLSSKTLTAPIINGSITGTPSMGADLLFTDATYDIGKSGATRPRDLFASRNASVGGTLGVTGVATFTQQSVHTQGVDLSTGGRVQFPATQNPTVNANCLDDYAEGTWTPRLIGTTSGEATYSTQLGRYQKIGKFVYLYCYIATATIGTLVGNLVLSGLPFTSATATVSGMLTCPHFTTLGSNTITLSGFVGSAVTTSAINRVTASAASVSAAPVATVGASEFIFVGQYEASA